MMSRFRSNDYWRRLDGVYARLPDCGHPLVERFAIDLYLYTPFHTVADLPPGTRDDPWERQSREVREFFRERAGRLMRGDLSVVPTHLPPGYGAWQVVSPCDRGG